MYSIFNTKIKKRSYLEEGEPPPKKLVTEEGFLIKKLSENQLKTNITLTEQLRKKKEFTSSETITNITSYIGGKRNLDDFETTVAYVQELNNLKSNGLSENDIEIYKDYTNLGSEFRMKYKSINEDALFQRITEIKALLSSTDESGFKNSTSSSSANQGEHQNSLKIGKSKFLKLDANNELKKDYLPSPMDELPNVEKQFMANIEEYSSCNIKKIRKKARSMGNKISSLAESNTIGEQNIKTNKYLQRHTQWDVKEEPTNLQRIDKDKVYGCKQQNRYTIKDGKIIKLDQNRVIPKMENQQNNIDKSKLTVDDIKNIPKFSNYDPGMPSKVLFLKNLRKNITESFLRNLLKEFDAKCYSVKIMGGKMIGQAFIEFQDITQASQALEIINGLVFEGSPIIAAYGKRKT